MKLKPKCNQKHLKRIDEQQPSREELCRAKIEECNALRCPYGISRTYDENGCEHCECENPCRNHECPEDSKCAVDLQADPEIGSTFTAICRKGKNNYSKNFNEFPFYNVKICILYS